MFFKALILFQKKKKNILISGVAFAWINVFVYIYPAYLYIYRRKKEQYLSKIS